ncbi:hypothetical protein CEXT_70941 [Caerostris extrusa]|uniref:Uncharacterized protein n=1 Tax=Caerostris extrusa TaxID=172846 RepID=A0AAV4MWD7_CAEEX|nr:hypothetical protein CEXT_70941 [Caerostris extrusa]
MHRFLDDRLPCRPEEKNCPPRQESKDVCRRRKPWPVEKPSQVLLWEDACDEFCGNPTPDRGMHRFLDDRLPCRQQESKDLSRRSHGRWKNFRKFFYGKDACEEFCGNPSPDRGIHRFLDDRLPCRPREKNFLPQESKDLSGRSYGRWKNLRKFFLWEYVCGEFCGILSPDRGMHRFLDDRFIDRKKVKILEKSHGRRKKGEKKKTSGSSHTTKNKAEDNMSKFLERRMIRTRCFCIGFCGNPSPDRGIHRFPDDRLPCRPEKNFPEEK